MRRSVRLLLCLLLLASLQQLTRGAEAPAPKPSGAADKAASKDDAKEAAKEAEAKAAKEAAAAAAARKQRLKELKQEAGFDHLVLVRTWPPSLCKLTQCNQATYNLFTISALRPTLANGTQLEACAGQLAFDRELLPLELRGRMSCEWRNFQTGNLPGFWAYQWDRHGACAAPLLGALLNATDEEALPAYFNETMRLHEAWDVNEALVRRGFNPLSATSATAAQLAGLLQRQWNVTAEVTCAAGMIYEVRTCFSLLLEPIDCPAAAAPAPGAAPACPRVAQDLPYGNDTIPALCQSYFDGIPKAENIDDPSAGTTSGAAARAASALVVLAAAAAALAAL